MLEYMLYRPRQVLETLRQETTRQLYTTSDLELLSSVVLYTRPLRIIDLPGMGAQLHLHGSDLNHINYGKIVDYNRNVLRKLNGYEASMGDLYAKLLDLKILDKGKDFQIDSVKKWRLKQWI